MDVVIPCYNAEASVGAAIASALAQKRVEQVWVIDDASTDASATVIEDWARRHPKRITPVFLARNMGAAAARNVALWRGDSALVAFLDADDAYEPQALDAAAIALEKHPHFALVRLSLVPRGLPEAYAAHPKFDRAWRLMEMTVGGNLVIRRPVLMACGGFPEAEVFRRLGGEDGALAIALHTRLQFGTLFGEPGVIYTFRPGAHAERLLTAQFSGELPPEVSVQDLARSRAVTRAIGERLEDLRLILAQSPPGGAALTVEWQEPGSSS